MYNVHMTHYTATEARRLFFRLLDAAQRGEEVQFERDGVRFKLAIADPEVPTSLEVPLVAVDPVVLSGEWTWSADEAGQVQFNPTGSATAPGVPS